MSDAVNVTHTALTIGVYDIPDTAYHADPCAGPSLSNSLAKVIWEECPLKAYLKHPRLNKNYTPDEPTPGMDFGSLGHKLLLGKGPEVDVCSKDDWKTDFAKNFRDDSRARGRIPTLQKTMDRAQALVIGATREFDRLGVLPDFTAAVKERTFIWRESDCYLRSMIDAVLVDETTCTVNIFDLKITKDASEDTCFKQIGNMNYDIQEHFQTRALQGCYPHLAGRVKHLFLFVEDQFPFLVTPVELTAEFKHLGRQKFGYALERWKVCTHENRWPGYTTGIVAAAPKPWDSKRVEEKLGLA